MKKAAAVKKVLAQSKAVVAHLKSKATKKKSTSAGTNPGLRTSILKTVSKKSAAPVKSEPQAAATAAPVKAAAPVRVERRSSRLKRFKKIFLEQRNTILYNDRIIREDFNASVDDRFDEIDQASTDVEQSMRMRLRSREMLYLKKVDDALKRIEDGSFGLCEECNEEIEVRRLEARPTATLCVGCKEEEERREHLSAAGREHKSLGEAFSRKYA